MAAYVPGARGQPGISGNRAFSTWLDFYRGCELLARPCSAETIPLVRRYFFRERATGKIFFLETGVVRPEALESLSKADLVAMAGHPQIRAQLEKAALPPSSALPSGTLGEIAGTKLSGEFLSNPSFLAAFFSTLSDRDYTPLVLKNLREILESHPDKWREYQNLAIAIAVVNDSPLPEFWPHIQVTPSLVPKEIPSVSAQFSR